MLHWIVLLLASSLGAQVAPLPKYKVVRDEIAAVNASADLGYRLLVPGRMFILRLEATPPDTYRYMAMDRNGGPVQFLNWVNEQGALGYRWVPGGENILEKEPHPRNYEYASVVQSDWSGKTIPGTTFVLVRQGYRPLESVFFPGRIGGGQAELFFEREVGAKPKSAPISEGKEIEIADAMKQADALAKEGYRYLAPSEARSGGRLLMQKCGPECEGPFQYRHFDVHSMGQLAKELNEQGKDGFRVVPKSLTSGPHLLERANEKTGKYAYHILSAKDPVVLEQALNAPEEEGYEPIGYVWRGGVWTVEAFLLLEKASTASAAQ